MKQYIRETLTENEAHDLLQTSYPLLIDTFNKSKEALEQRIAFDISMGITTHFEKVKAMLMWHYAVNFSSQIFADHSEFTPVVHNQVYGLSYNEALFIRFKKLNQQFQTSNIPTKQSIALNNQWTIDGFPSKPCILTVGYVIDNTHTGFQSINLICAKNQKPLWNINLLDAQSTNQEIPFVPFEEQVSTSIEKLLKIKEEKKKKRENG